MEKRYNNVVEEEKTQKTWLEQQTYTVKNNPGQLYSIDTPPPTVSGNLHIGHIFSYTQTDIIARYKRMSGFSVFYPFGFDDNGLPTEKYVEKKHKVRAHQMKRSDFIQLCLQETKIAAQEFTKLWQRMGLSADWNKTYSTISDESRKLSQESFIKLYKDNFIYRKQEPALYCTTCQTTVAQAELDDVEKPSFFNTIAFKSQDGKELLIGTTRPELLPSCVALFYHPDDKRYQSLKGQKAITPLFDIEVPILPDDQVDPEKGTGLVMCCTFGDKTDVHWFKTHNLPFKQSINLYGKLTENTGELAGLKVADARKKVLELLQQAGLLKEQKAMSHAVNVHERCKKEIEYTVLPQWFISILEHKKTFLDLAEQIEWQPSFMQSRYKNWVENLSWDWCISRQRFYGIPFPVWHCKDCNHIIIADIKDLPIDPQETTYKGSCPECKGTNIVGDTDVMDTWNTSSITPYICYNLFDNNVDVFDTDAAKNFIPMSMRPQAHDIIRTWAFYTIIKTWMHNKSIPWKSIVISGHVLSDAKEKLSKSKGNNKLAPETLLKTYSADAIRYWTASGRLGHDVAFSENQLKIGNRLITKLWNAFRFISSHLENLDPKKTPSNLGIVNEWLLHQASDCFTGYEKNLNQHEFSLALDKAEQFFWQDFCDNYLELIKHQLFNADQYTAEQVHATQWTLYNVGLRILQLYAPYIPHITETIYQLLYKEHERTASIHQTQFKDIQKNYSFDESIKKMAIINNLIAAVRKLKTEQQLSLKTEIAKLTIASADQTIIDLIKQEEQLIKGVAQAHTIAFDNQKNDFGLKQIDDVWHAHVAIKED